MRTDTQLRDLFNRTFDALPPRVQHEIEELWRHFGVERENGGNSGRFLPSVYKQAVLSETPDRLGESGSIVFRFKTTVVHQAPDAILQILIAHELAHASRAASRLQGTIPLNTSVDDEENAANALQAQWGFSRDPLLEWVKANESALQI